METQQNSDARATERVFKKVVHPGLETLRVVDRNGIPLHCTGLNSVRSKSFIVSPRGVPMKPTNHVYSGYHSHPAKTMDLVEQTSSDENIYGPEKTFLTQPLSSYSAKLPRKRNESPMHLQKRASTSQSMSPPKHVPKIISSDHYLTSEAQERRILQSANNNSWNFSNQGLRLQREWTNLSTTRSIKRASEIVNHRVDRMYFMSGNSIQLKPRYDVDEEEMKRMKEIQAKNKEMTHKRVHIKGINLMPTNIVMEAKGDNPASASHVTDEDNKENLIEGRDCCVCEPENDVGHDVRHVVSLETGINEMDIKEEHINFGMEDIQFDSKEKDGGPVNIKGPEDMDINRGPLNVFDILSHESKQLLGKCLIDLMKNNFPGKKIDFYDDYSRYVSSSLKKSRKVRKKTPKKLKFDEEELLAQYPGLKILPRRKPPKKKTESAPVVCDCRKPVKDGFNLKIKGRQLPMYQYIFWDEYCDV